ncbi:unnamed protein product [Vitrella brassicaformis CCMP3155]|uniref:subtilisin n=1 Tax=Vitrella brassicaformis (strain CCMP3155) TaxID=1169540 RepID=A0A0G4GZE5_VITBC|nr:unnamed protein product [Vitrella brassicaformis CCMP3155]|eukprot:CEM36359.1 unnamed protein product [Vitrella brassicaformis CCMP3155]
MRPRWLPAAFLLLATLLLQSSVLTAGQAGGIAVTPEGFDEDIISGEEKTVEVSVVNNEAEALNIYASVANAAYQPKGSGAPDMRSQLSPDDMVALVDQKKGERFMVKWRDDPTAGRTSIDDALRQQTDLAGGLNAPSYASTVQNYKYLKRLNMDIMDFATDGDVKAFVKAACSSEDVVFCEFDQTVRIASHGRGGLEPVDTTPTYAFSPWVKENLRQPDRDLQALQYRHVGAASPKTPPKSTPPRLKKQSTSIPSSEQNASSLSLGPPPTADSYIQLYQVDHQVPLLDDCISGNLSCGGVGGQLAPVADADQYTGKEPNDPLFADGSLWGLQNQANTGIDIQATEAWSIVDSTLGGTLSGERAQGTGHIVGVIDTGVDYNHEDLQNVMWVNPDEIPDNGEDDDGNGFVDDVYGWDFANDDNDPADDEGHGTHCAGTIMAEGGNAKGIVGVAYGSSTKIMALKFLEASGSGSVSNAVKAVEYAITKKAKILNNSWGGGGSSAAMETAVQECCNSDIMFVAAAGNEGTDNDATAFYPANYDGECVISVMALAESGVTPQFTNYGATKVDICAPGVNIASCQPGNQYTDLSGTSMAAPHVAGAVALVWEVNPSLNYPDVKKLIMDTVQKLDQLEGKCVSEGLLDAAASVADSYSSGGWISILDTFNVPSDLPAGGQINIPVILSPKMDGTYVAQIVVSAENAAGSEVDQAAVNVTVRADIQQTGAPPTTAPTQPPTAAPSMAPPTAAPSMAPPTAAPSMAPPTDPPVAPTQQPPEVPLPSTEPPATTGTPRTGAPPTETPSPSQPPDGNTGPQLRDLPAYMDLGSGATGVPMFVKYISFANDGGETLEVKVLRFTGGNYMDFISNPSMPATTIMVEPGNEVDGVQMGFFRMQAAEITTTLEIETNEEGGKAYQIELHAVTTNTTLSPPAVVHETGSMSASDDTHIEITNGGGTAMTYEMMFVPTNRALYRQMNATVDGYFIARNDRKEAMPAFAWNDASTGKMAEQRRLMLSNEDDAVAEVMLPFPFHFWGEDHEVMYICTNGFITFKAWDFEADRANEPGLGKADGLKAVIAPYWCDLTLVGKADADVWVYHTESEVVVQWQDLRHFGDPASHFTFQVVLEKTGAIHFFYNEMEGSGGVGGTWAQVGLASLDGTMKVDFEPSGSFPTSRSAVTFHPQSSEVDTWFKFSSTSDSDDTVTVTGDSQSIASGEIPPGHSAQVAYEINPTPEMKDDVVLTGLIFFSMHGNDVAFADMAVQVTVTPQQDGGGSSTTPTPTPTPGEPPPGEGDPPGSPPPGSRPDPLKPVVPADSNLWYFVRYPGFALRGFNEETINDLTVEACADRCVEQAWCLSFDYEVTRTACKLSKEDRFTQPSAWAHYGHGWVDFYEFYDHEARRRRRQRRELHEHDETENEQNENEPASLPLPLPKANLTTTVADARFLADADGPLLTNLRMPF